MSNEILVSFFLEQGRADGPDLYPNVNLMHRMLLRVQEEMPLDYLQHAPVIRNRLAYCMESTDLGLDFIASI
jgi:hypothetical protein